MKSESVKEYPHIVIIPVAMMDMSIYMVTNAETRETRLFCRKLPFKLTTYVRLGNTARLVSFIRLRLITMRRSTLIPPDVEPAHEPQYISRIVRNREKEPQPSASVIENPVEVIAETIWNRGCIRKFSTERHSPRINALIISVI